MPTSSPATVADRTTLSSASDQIRRRERTCADVVEHCLQTIDRFEDQVRAWVSVDRTGAARTAQQLDQELAAGRWRGPLHGIPIAIKDIVDIENCVTAAGSPLLHENVAAADATIVTRLRGAGAVILGKTVTTQFASFDPPATRNPWNLEHTPGGSSSGSAAAVASSMCLGAIGSQTGGSITRPASFCGVAGCKPTYGRVSTAGVLPLAPSMDHPGPIARSVRDLAILLEVIAGADPRDPLCSSVPVPSYANELETPIRPPRLGMLGGMFVAMADESSRRALESAMLRLRQDGASGLDVEPPSSFNDVIQSHMVIMSVEAAAEHEARFRQHPQQFLAKIRHLIETGLATPAPAYLRAKRHQHALKRLMIECFYEFDALVTPATVGPAPDRTSTGDPAFNSPWSFTGFPTVSIPTGFSDNQLPLGIQLIGRPFEEAQLFRVAHWCEQALADS